MDSNLSIEQQAYLHGFSVKCAEVGVDPAKLAASVNLTMNPSDLEQLHAPGGAVKDPSSLLLNPNLDKADPSDPAGNTLRHSIYRQSAKGAIKPSMPLANNKETRQ